MNARSDSIGRQITRASDLVVAQAGYLAHHEYVAVEFVQRREGSVYGGADILGGGSGPFVDQWRHFRTPKPRTVIVKRQVSCDVEEPGSGLAMCRGQRGDAADP